MKPGIYRKFHVLRTDGSSEPGGKHEHCSYFVLDLEHDECALPALRMYARKCRKEKPELADDLEAIVATNGGGRFGPQSPSEMAARMMEREEPGETGRIARASVRAFAPDWGAAREEADKIREELGITDAAEAEPIPMVLHCKNCGMQHIDGPNPEKGWTNPPHRSHECQRCGCIWRPADVATTGVAEVTTRGSADTWAPATVAAPDLTADTFALLRHLNEWQSTEIMRLRKTEDDLRAKLDAERADRERCALLTQEALDEVRSLAPGALELQELRQKLAATTEALRGLVDRSRRHSALCVSADAVGMSVTEDSCQCHETKKAAFRVLGMFDAKKQRETA